MRVVKDFNHDMIEGYLKAKDLNYLRDRDGDFVVQFGGSSKTGCNLELMIQVEGSHKQILVVRIIGQRPIPKSDWGRVVMLCNDWNRKSRWPKAFLYYEGPNAAEGKIMLEEQIDLGTGIHQELLNDFIETVFGSSVAFWEIHHRDHGL